MNTDLNGRRTAIGVSRIHTVESVVGPLQLLNLALILTELTYSVLFTGTVLYSRVPPHGFELRECGANTGNLDTVQRPLRSVIMGSFPCVGFEIPNVHAHLQLLATLFV